MWDGDDDFCLDEYGSAAATVPVHRDELSAPPAESSDVVRGLNHLVKSLGLQPGSFVPTAVPEDRRQAGTPEGPHPHPACALARLKTRARIPRVRWHA